MISSHPHAHQGLRRLTLRKLVVCGVTLLVTLGIFWSWRPAKQPFADKHYIEQAATCKVGDETRLLGGSSGFMVFGNVWFHDHSFYFVGDKDDLPSENEIFTDMKLHVSSSPLPTPDVCFSGTTLFLNEAAGPSWHGLWHYYHFAVENILGGFAALGTIDSTSTTKNVPDRIIIPWNTGWHDKYAMNDVVVDAIFANAVVEQDQWGRLEQQGWIFFEQIIIVDRHAPHRTSPRVDVWNKMPLDIFEAPKADPDFFDPARDRLHEYFGVKSTKAHQRITYIDRQKTSRRLSDHDHEEVWGELAALARDNGIGFEHLLLEDMEPAEQFKAVARSTILIGIHGNGLTHLLWLPKHSAVVELFPPKGFLIDYMCAAETLGHNYTAIRGDEILTKEMLEADPGNKNDAVFHNWTTVEINVPLLVEEVRKQIRPA